MAKKHFNGLINQSLISDRECLGEAHEPASCEHWSKWFRKIAEIKPEEREYQI